MAGRWTATDVIGDLIPLVGMALLAITYLRSLDPADLGREYPRLMRTGCRWTAMFMIASILGWLTAEISSGAWWLRLLSFVAHPVIFGLAFLLLVAPDFEPNWRRVRPRLTGRIGVADGVLLLIGIVSLIVGIIGSFASP